MCQQNSVKKNSDSSLIRVLGVDMLFNLLYGNYNALTSKKHSTMKE